MQKKIVVDANHNPTLLFQHINNNDIQGAISRVQSNPEECKVWIACRQWPRYNNQELVCSDDGDMITVWKYLPLHLICLSIQRYYDQNHRERYHSSQHPDSDETYFRMKQLVHWLVKMYPKAIVVKDYHGNLPIHYLLQHRHRGQEGMTLSSVTFDEELFNKLMDSKFSNLKKKDGYGRSLQDLVYNNSYYHRGSDVTLEEEREGIVSRHDQLHANELEQWIKRLEAEYQQRGDLSAMTMDKEESFGNSWFVHEQQQSQQQRRQEIDELHQKHKKLEKHASKLELECLSKDDTIESLSAQIMSLETKVQRMKSSQQQKFNRTAQQQQQQQQQQRALASTSTSTLTALRKENKSLKKKIELDSEIVSKQHEDIEKLTKKVHHLQQEKEVIEHRSKQATQRFNLFKSDLENNNDSIAHLRQVTNVLQSEIEAKSKENESLHLKVIDLERQNKMLEDKLQDEERGVDRSVALLQKELKEQREVIQILEQSISKVNNHNSNFGAIETSGAGGGGGIFFGDDYKFSSPAANKQDGIEETSTNSNEQNRKNKIYMNLEGNSVSGTCTTSSEEEKYQHVQAKGTTEGCETPTITNLNEKQPFSLSKSVHTRISSSSSSFEDYWNDNQKDTDEGSVVLSTEKVESKHQQFGTSKSNLESTHDDLKLEDKQMDIEKRQLRLRQDLKDIYSQIKSVRPQEDGSPSRAGTVDSGVARGAGSGATKNKVSFLIEERKTREKDRPWRTNRKFTASELGSLILGGTE